MGVSIHYRFLLHSDETVVRLQRVIKTLAQKLGMRIRVYDENQRRLLVDPAPGCETLDLSFVRRNGGWVCDGSCKTQSAGWGVHVRVAELLRFLAAFCSSVQLLDEGGYYETRDAGVLVQAFNWHRENLERLHQAVEG